MRHCRRRALRFRGSVWLWLLAFWRVARNVVCAQTSLLYPFKRFRPDGEEGESRFARARLGPFSFQVFMGRFKSAGMLDLPFVAAMWYCVCRLAGRATGSGKNGNRNTMTKKETGFSSDARAYPESLAYRFSPDEALGDEISIGDITRYIRDAFPRMIAGALIAGCIALGAMLALRLLLPSVAIYRTAAVITMSGAEPGKYPNGAEFALTDLRSPVVLDEVFRANNLAGYGLRLSDFLGMVGIEAYSPALDSVKERFRKRLEDKTLTFEERKSVEADFNQALSGFSATGVLVALNIPESYKISDSLGQKIVDDIPASWASVFIERLGVTSLPVPVSGSNLIDVAFLGDLDYPLAYDYLAGQASKLQIQLDSIRSLPNSISFISSKSGKGIADLQREADAIDQYRLKLNLKPIVDQGLSRDPTVTVLIYKNQINSLQKDAGVQSEYSGKVSTVLSDFRANKGGALAGNALSSSAPAAIGTQFDGAFVDKIIELSKQGAGVEFEQGLLQKKLEMENLSVSYTDQQIRLAERRDAILNNTLTPEVRKLLEGQFMAGLGQATGELNRLWSDSFEFVNELSNKRLNFDKALYRLNELPSDRRVEKPQYFTSRSILTVLAIAFLGAALGLASFVWRRALKGK